MEKHEILIMPTKKEITLELRSCPFGMLRGLIDCAHDNLYLWPSDRATHETVASLLKLDYRYDAITALIVGQDLDTLKFEADWHWGDVFSTTAGPVVAVRGGDNISLKSLGVLGSLSFEGNIDTIKGLK